MYPELTDWGRESASDIGSQGWFLGMTWGTLLKGLWEGRSEADMSSLVKHKTLLPRLESFLP